MDQATLELVKQILPWALLGVVAIGWWLWVKSAELKKVQRAAHQASKMGLNDLTELLDAIARSDRPAILAIVEKLVAEYSGKDGVMKFGYNVFNNWIDDALNDPEYADRVGKRLEEVFLGTIISPEQQMALGGVSANFGKLGLKSAQNFFQGLATGKVAPARDAIRDIVSRFSTADGVDDEIVKLAPAIMADIKQNHPEHLPKLRALLLSGEESAVLSAGIK